MCNFLLAKNITIFVKFCVSIKNIGEDGEIEDFKIDKYYAKN